MIIQGPEKQWADFEDIHLLNYCCVEYAMMGVYWLGTAGFKNAVVMTVGSIFTLPKEYQWAHTVCEVNNLGTYDFQNNIFFPDYYYHQGPVTDEQVDLSSKAVGWTDIQHYSCIDTYYKYHPKEVGIIEASQFQHRQTRYINDC